MTDKNNQIETSRSLHDETLALREYTALLREREIPYSRNYGFEERDRIESSRVRVEVIVHEAVDAAFHR